MVRSRSLVFDIEEGIRGNAEPFSGHLDGEGRFGLERIGESSQLGNELGT